MTVLEAENLRRVVIAVAEELQNRRAELDRADALLGDGDTGTMLATASSAVVSALEDASADTPGEVLSAVSAAIKGSTGSSLGTLLAVGLRSVAKHFGNESSISESQFGEALVVATEKLKAAGGASSGDKTIIDSVEAIAGSPFDAAVAAERVLLEFRDRPCRAGRARLYPESSVGADDPGMLAVAIMARVAAVS
jgi:phosphoenolpyruvate---glycerone phosphotransferase subunit DhaL